MLPFVPRTLPFEGNVIDVNFFLKELLEGVEKVSKYQTLLENCRVNPDLVLSPITLKEALQSTKIEGTKATLDEVIESKENTKEQNQDIKEVLNYFEAFELGKNLLKTLPISTRLFQELHKTLLKGNVRGKDRNPGEFRKIQNFIGPEGYSIHSASFVPPEPQLVDKYISNLEFFINSDDDSIHPFIKIAIIHAQFETIHPFLDGNGRIGRILIPLFLYQSKAINAPNFFISDILEIDKHKYYKLLNDTRLKDNWNDWIKFFLSAIAKQSDKNINLIQKINELYETDTAEAMNKVKNTNVMKIMDCMFDTPIFTVKQLQAKTGIPDGTIRNYLNKLEDAGLIYSNLAYRNKKYYYYGLLDLIR